MKTIIHSISFMMWLFTATHLHANFLREGAKEIGGGISGSVQNQYNFTSLGLTLSPTFNYYFSNHWFVATGLSLGYFYETTRHLTTDYTSSYAQFYPKFGLGFYTAVTDNLAFAMPIYLYYEFNFGSIGNLSERSASYYDGAAYSIDPTLKIRISENVLLSPFITIRSLFYRQTSQEVVYKIFYGLSWTYIW